MTAHHTSINESFQEHVRSGLFEPIRRTLTNEVEADDRLAEGVAHAFVEFRRRARRGEDTDIPLLVHICKQRAQDIGRRLATDGSWRCRDVYDGRAYRDGHVQLLRLEGILKDLPDDKDRTILGYAEALASRPERKLNSALNLEAWVGTLPEQDQTILASRMEGQDLVGIGTEIGRSVSWTCRRLRDLGQELATRAGIRIDDDSRKRRGRRPTRRAA